jgi:hypothetical protein
MGKMKTSSSFKESRTSSRFEDEDDDGNDGEEGNLQGHPFIEARRSLFSSVPIVLVLDQSSQIFTCPPRGMLLNS